MADTKFKPLDVSGQRFHYLTAVRRVGFSAGKSRSAIWEFRCDCGRLHRSLLSNVKHGHTRSCGCMKRRLIGETHKTHGHAADQSSTRTYISWRAMLARCEYEGDKEFSRYGGRGITVCHQWHEFESFLADMGERPMGKTLDRIDNEKGYEPSNCRWATHKEQVANRRPTERRLSTP